LIEDGDLERLEWRDRKPVGSEYLTRWGHSSTVYDNKIYIFGGRFCNDLNDLLVLNVEKNTMKVAKVVGEVPKARRRHSACFIGSCMIMFGGFNGEYFNDLHYVNAFELRSRLQVPVNEYQSSVVKHINNKRLSDMVVYTKDKEIFYLHKGLLFNVLKS
jgi:N-acetylneuraminic acid mutarotase